MILGAALIFLGPQKLPEVARMLGRGMRELRQTASDFTREIQFPDTDGINPKKIAARKLAEARRAATKAVTGEPSSHENNQTATGDDVEAHSHHDTPPDDYEDPYVSAMNEEIAASEEDPYLAAMKEDIVPAAPTETDRVEAQDEATGAGSPQTAAPSPKESIAAKAGITIQPPEDSIAYGEPTASPKESENG